MLCPLCGGRMMIVDSVFNEKENEHYRRRKCRDCQYKFWTVEFVSEDAKQMLSKLRYLGREINKIYGDY